MKVIKKASHSCMTSREDHLISPFVLQFRVEYCKVVFYK